MGRAGRVWKCVLDKAYIAVNGPSRAILVRAQEEKRSAAKKAYIFLENIEVILKRMLVEIWTVKAMDEAP